MTHDNAPKPGVPDASDEAMCAHLDAMLDDIHLGALGLLDDDEHRALEAWIASVDPALRRQVIAEQVRGASSLPMVDVAPREALKARVIHAVLEAIREAAEAQRPGVRTRRHAAAGVAASAGPSHRRVKRTHPFWRAAAMGLAVLVIGMVTMHIRLQQEFGQLARQAEISSLIDIAGSPALEGLLFDGTARRINFVPVDNRGTARAMLFISEDSEAAHVYTMRLPSDPGVTYAIARVDAAGDPEPTPIATFSASGVVRRIDVPKASLLAGTIAIVAVENGVSRVLMTATVA